MVFIGAIIGGKNTAQTLGKEILAPEMMNYITVSIILLSVSLALLISNLLGIPQSTSQATVMAVVAPAAYFHMLNTDKLFFQILPTWFITPLAAFILSYLIGKYIYKPLRKKGYTISSKVNQSPILKTLIIVMSLYVAFSIGANNVANAAGPISIMASNEIGIDSKYFVHVLILSTLIIAPNFAIGSSIFGNKIVQNTGKEIVLFGRIEAIIIAFISATLLLAASLIKGIPTSLVQLNVGAILGIGVAKLGFKNIFRKTEVNKFFVMWIIAPIIAFAISLFLIYLADSMEMI
jgi:sulfate permease